MFHWICPECGREIPPAVKECPACDPHAVAAMPPAPPVQPALAALPSTKVAPSLMSSAVALLELPDLPEPSEQRPQPNPEGNAAEESGPDFTKRTQQLMPPPRPGLVVG